MPSLLRPQHRHASPSRVNPLYGYGYNPAWPSILSVAHDTADGSRVFVVTDRPCVAVGGAFGQPLSIVGSGGGALAVFSLTQVLPVKFRLGMTGYVPAGATWRWDAAGPGGGNDLVDPITGHGLNAAAGDVADVPGPWTPPPPAVVSGAFAGGQAWCTLTFDRPVNPIPGRNPGDGSVDLNGQAPLAVERVDAYTLRLAVANPLYTGSAWTILTQPSWLATEVAWPQNGTFEKWRRRRGRAAAAADAVRVALAAPSSFSGAGQVAPPRP